jgi:hypothetical protein
MLDADEAGRVGAARIAQTFASKMHVRTITLESRKQPGSSLARGQITHPRQCENVVRLRVRPSIGNFFEAGVSKRLFSKLRLDVTHFNRDMTNFADDDLLLNTGVSFPIAFDHAEIRGTEVKLDLPRWRALSGFVS